MELAQDRILGFCYVETSISSQDQSVIWLIGWLVGWLVGQ
jgi:hypothetical protein